MVLDDNEKYRQGCAYCNVEAKPKISINKR